MTSPPSLKLGCTSHADLIDLVVQSPQSFSADLVRSLGYELDESTIPTTDDEESAPGIIHPADPATEPTQSGSTQFQPEPTKYWRITGYESVEQPQPDEQQRRREKREFAKLPDPEEIRRKFGFSVEHVLPREPLAETNYVTTQLRRAAGKGRSRNDLDLLAADLDATERKRWISGFAQEGTQLCLCLVPTPQTLMNRSKNREGEAPAEPLCLCLVPTSQTLMNRSKNREGEAPAEPLCLC